MQYTHESPRSYVVRHEGGELHRNRRHLRITREQLPLFLPELDDPCSVVAAQPSRRVVVQPPLAIVAQPPRRVVAQPSRRVVVQPLPGVVAQSESPPGVVAQSESPPGVVAQPPPGVAEPPRRSVAEPPRRAIHQSEHTQRYSRYGRMITKPNRFDC